MPAPANSNRAPAPSAPGFVRYAWSVVAANVLVILWGAYVRASGSGAGCGSHWPLCNGEMIPQPRQMQTLVEFGHRVTSGLALLLVLGLLVWAFRRFPADSLVRGAAVASMVFILLEAVIGAGLVLFELVAQDASIARAFSLGAHLANTFFLLGSLTLTAWWGAGHPAPRVAGQGAVPWLVGTALLATLALGVTGAITALGDTLFPAGSLADGLAQDLSPTTALLVRLRVIHPTLAAAVGTYALVVAWLVAGWRRHNPTTRRAAQVLAGLFAAQLVVGLVNLGLLAPVATQLLHLLMADAVWVSLVLLGATSLASSSPTAEAHEHEPRQRQPAIAPAG